MLHFCQKKAKKEPYHHDMARQMSTKKSTQKRLYPYEFSRNPKYHGNQQTIAKGLNESLPLRQLLFYLNNLNGSFITD